MRSYNLTDQKFDKISNFRALSPFSPVCLYGQDLKFCQIFGQSAYTTSLFSLWFNLTARVFEDSFTQDSQKFKLCWKLYNVNIRLFCYYDFFILCHVAEIWPKTSNRAQKWELRKLRKDNFFWKMMTIGDYLTTDT